MSQDWHCKEPLTFFWTRRRRGGEGRFSAVCLFPSALQTDVGKKIQQGGGKRGVCSDQRLPGDWGGAAAGNPRHFQNRPTWELGARACRLNTNAPRTPCSLSQRVARRPLGELAEGNLRAGERRAAEQREGGRRQQQQQLPSHPAGGGEGKHIGRVRCQHT